MTDYHHAVDVLRFAVKTEEPCALVTVTDIHGGSMRSKGSLMAITPTKSAGYISNGCVDGDIIFQARAAEDAVSLIYGDGSPFKDITLPCGGAIHVRVEPKPDKKHLSEILSELESRQEATLNFGDWNWQYSPKLRIRIAGRGAAADALARQAKQAGFEVHLQSPEIGMVGFDRVDHLTDLSSPPEVTDDKWTALVLMFHDHDWEYALLEQALKGDAFYIGAMGSIRTHQDRCTMLKDRGISAGDIGRIYGPIGIIPTMRDANLLALSTLAEIVKTAQDKARL